MGKQDYYQRNFSANLRWYMQKNGITQQRMIEDLGIPSGSLSAWCSGKRIPRMDKVQMLADYFHIKITDLLEDRTEEMADEMFKEKQLLFDKISKASTEDILKINQIAEMVLGGK